ncbi:MAG TPA: universal stress protein [Burkholderiales bacterium]|nr:universal stress protein [Burkholderiales bacterium]
MKILIAADGSAYTREAVDYVVKHLQTLGAKPEICLLHVQFPLPGRASAYVQKSVLQDYYLSESRKALKLGKLMLDRANVPYQEKHMVGDPGTTIASVASSGKFDLVVMGSHGHGSLRNLLLGSVASKVLATCKVPVLIIR